MPLHSGPLFITLHLPVWAGQKIRLENNLTQKVQSQAKEMQPISFYILTKKLRYSVLHKVIFSDYCAL